MRDGDLTTSRSRTPFIDLPVSATEDRVVVRSTSKKRPRRGRSILSGRVGFR
ncbi:MAG: hypothetical protein M5U34_15755 [Chloroflexi bacterium]|nr:hypothetical protein [Chloroflexota bacterium]